MSTGLAAMLMNPAKNKAGKKKTAKSKTPKSRTHKAAGTLPKAPKQKKESKAKKSGKNSSSKRRAKRRRVIVVTPNNRIHKLPSGSRLRFTHRPKIKKLKKKSAQRLTKAQRNDLKLGKALKLRKGKRTVTGMMYRNPRRRRHSKRNPQFNLKTILGYGGGAAAAILVHKYGIMTLGNLLSKLPVVGSYAAMINTNKWANMAAKAALAGGVFYAGKKAKNDQVKLAAKAYLVTALAGVALQAIGMDSKLMIAQAGMGEIEMLNGIEDMGEIEHLNGIEEMGDVDGIEDMQGTDYLEGEEYVGAGESFVE